MVETGAEQTVDEDPKHLSETATGWDMLKLSCAVLFERSPATHSDIRFFNRSSGKQSLMHSSCTRTLEAANGSQFGGPKSPNTWVLLIRADSSGFLTTFSVPEVYLSRHPILVVKARISRAGSAGLRASCDPMLSHCWGFRGFEFCALGLEFVFAGLRYGGSTC